MNTEAVLPREPFCTTSSPGTVRRTCSTVSACWFSMSLAVMTVAEVVTWDSGVSVRVEVTNTGGSVVRVTNQAGADTDPSWSPDGKQLAFVSWRDSDITGTSDLYAVTLDNMQVTRLTDAGVQVGSPSWAPGGKQIAFTAGDFEGGNTDIFVLTLDGLRLTRLTDGTATPGTDEAPSWSPDSKQIAFASTRASESREIYTMNADGKAVTRLTFNLVEDLNPAWNR